MKSEVTRSDRLLEAALYKRAWRLSGGPWRGGAGYQKTGRSYTDSSASMCKYPPRARLGTVVTQLQFFRAGGPCECPHPYQRAAIRTEQATL